MMRQIHPYLQSRQKVPEVLNERSRLHKLPLCRHNESSGADASSAHTRYCMLALHLKGLQVQNLLKCGKSEATLIRLC